MRLLRLAAVVLVAFALLPGASAVAMFRASNLVVVPVASSLAGLNSSNWHTDLEIQNVDTVPIDVLIIFLPSASASNVSWFADLTNHLSGRAEDGFGKTDTSLENIPAGRAVVLSDVIRTNWADNTKGALLVFAYQAGTYKTTTPPGGVPALIVVRSRTYDLGTTATSTPTTYGQSIPGLPWYYAIDPMLESKGFNEAVFSGIREDSQYRTDIGFLNTSDILTALYVQATLTAADGTVLGTAVKFMYPLEQEQWDQAASTLFGVDTTTSPVTNATLSVRVSAWQSTAAAPATGLIVYASRVDNTSNDPVYLEQSFVRELPWNCVFNGNCSAAQALSAPHSGVFRQSLLPPSPAR